MRSNVIAASRRIFTEGDEFLVDIPQEQWFQSVPPFVNHVAWHIGHLAVTLNFGLKVLGQDLVVPMEWADLYGRGSTPDNDNANQPTTTELFKTMNKAHERLIAGYEQVDDEVLAAANVLERLRDRYPTNGDFAAFLLTSHAGLHFGQIAMLRKMLAEG
ncbi:MAG: DinB family protein [Phycisphaeraceae bacterium JB051]